MDVKKLIQLSYLECILSASGGAVQAAVDSQRLEELWGKAVSVGAEQTCASRRAAAHRTVSVAVATITVSVATSATTDDASISIGKKMHDDIRKRVKNVVKL